MALRVRKTKLNQDDHPMNTNTEQGQKFGSGPFRKTFGEELA